MLHDKFHDASVHFENKLKISAEGFYSSQCGSIVFAGALNVVSTTSFAYPVISCVSKLWDIFFI